MKNLNVFPSVTLMHSLSALLAIILLTLAAHAQSGAIIGSFQPVATFAGLVSDGSGNIYGVENAGVAGCQGGDCGEVFELTQNSGTWTQKTIYTFTGGTDGSQPAGGLIRDSAGNLYGTTSSGGDLSACNGAGCGVVFKLAKSASGVWFETVLFAFKGGSDGAVPTSLIQNASGVLFGTALFGGNLNSCAGYGCGVVFQLTPHVTGWNETVLYSFNGGSNGQTPAGLVLGSSGNIVGTAIVATASDLSKCANFCGALVFNLSWGSKGWKESTIHKFQGQYGFEGPVGTQFFSGLISDASGNIYGTAYSGGKGCNPTGCGFIFKLSPDGAAWKESTLYSFNGQADGAGPTAGLIFDTAGNLYGGTQAGNVTGCNPFENGYCGQLFKLSPGSNGWSIAAVFGTPYFWTPTGNFLSDASGNVYASVCDEYYYNGGDVLELMP